MNNRIFRAHFVGRKSVVRDIPNFNKFAFDKKKGWIYVQKICFYILRKIGCIAFDRIADVETVCIDKQKLVEQIMVQKIICWDWYQKEPTRLLIGSSTLSELMGDPEMYHHFQFMIHDRIHMQNGNQRRVFDLDITVIPTMNGIIVLP